jgi:HK97 family phage major capsid protein
MNLKQKLYELKNQRAEQTKAAEDALEKGDSAAYDAAMEQIKALNTQIGQVEQLIQEKDNQAQEPEGTPAPALAQTPAQTPEEGYTKAVKDFATAARTGFRVTNAAGDMMSEGVDSDGGYTVPPDIVTKILTLREAKESLLSEVTVIPVQTPSGRRTYKTRSQHTGFATVAEAAKMGKLATPQFTTVTYEIEKRRGYLPVTNELLADSDNNISSVVEEWFADEARATGNREILEIIQSKEAVDLTNLDGILAAWVGLGSAFRSTSKLITNDDGLLWLGTLKDENGRYLLTPNPAEPQQLRLCVGPHTLAVKTYDNDTIPSSEGKIPMILGDLHEGVTYWDRQTFTLQVTTTAVVGNLNAFEQDLTLWAGSLRDDCTLRDEAAFVNGYISATAGAVG